MKETDSTPHPKRRLGLRYVFVGAILGILSVLVCTGIFLVLRAPLPELTEASLDAAMDQWDAHGPASYDMDLKLEGARPGTVHIEVRDGQVTAMQRDGRTPRERRTWQAWTVTGQFDTLMRELELAADPVGQMQAGKGTRIILQAIFEPHFGFPQRYRRNVMGTVPEISWEVTDFQPRP